MSSLPRLAKQNNKEEIVLRLQNGVDVNEKGEYGGTALYHACWKNRTEIVEILLKHKKINVNLQSNNGRSPFWIACGAGNNECALIMLQDPRVDVNMADGDGWSPLMIACYFGNTKTVQLLISYGRNIDIHKKSTKNNWLGIKSCSTALDAAKQQNRTDIVKLLQQYQNNPKETQKTTRIELNLKGKK